MNALQRFLVDFDLEAAPVPPAAPAWGADSEADPLSEPEALTWSDDPAPDGLGDVLAFEPDDGEPALDTSDAAAALAEAETRHAAALAALEVAHAENLAAERARWTAEEGTRLAEGFAHARTEIGEALAEGAAAILEPFLTEAVRDAAMVELRQAVADLLVSGTAASIAITGPADLVDALRTALAADGVEDARLGFTEADTVEVTVSADASTIQTRFGAWAQTLQRHLGNPQ